MSVFNQNLLSSNYVPNYVHNWEYSSEQDTDALCSLELTI